MYVGMACVCAIYTQDMVDNRYKHNDESLQQKDKISFLLYITVCRTIPWLVPSSVMGDSV